MSTIEPRAFAAALGDWQIGSGPVYRRLAGAIRVRIEAGEIALGAGLPAERGLASALDLSRTSVVSAYQLLRDEGWLESRQGSGSRVCRAGTGSGVSSAVHGRVVADLGTIERGQVLRGLVEASGARVELLGLHLPPASAQVAAAVAHLRRDVVPLLEHHGYWPLGLPELRRDLAARLTRAGLPSRPEEILITQGAQEAISLAAAALLGPGRSVVLEDPTYLGAIDLFAATGARLVPVQVGAEGIRIDDLRAAVVREAPSLIYLMPSFQNPTGILTPESRRRELARLAAERGVPILEDEALADLDHGTPPPPPIAAFAPGAPIFTAGSLSKLMWGGLRVGWIRAPASFLDALARRKAVRDLGSSVLSQEVAVRLLPHAEEIRAARRRQNVERLAVMEKELARQLPEWTWQRPTGGASLWVRLPRGNALDFARLAARHGVAVLPGPICSPTNGCAGFLRLPFVLEPAALRAGIRLLARAWRAYAPATPRERAALEVLV